MQRGYACVALYNPKNAANLGGSFRAAHVFGASLLIVSGQRIQRSAADVTKAWRHIPLIERAKDDLMDAIPYDCVPVAVEIASRATDLPAFHHPERAAYIFGPEDSSVPDTITAKCRHIVQIPSQFCLNLASAVSVVLYDRAAKQHERSRLVPLHMGRKEVARL